MTEQKLLDILMQPVEIAEVTNTIRGLRDDALIIEWGCGGSTQRWLNALKPRQTLVSIEHRKEWYDKVSLALDDHPKRHQLQFHCIPVDGPAAEAYANFVEEFPGGADDYVGGPAFPAEMEIDLWSADMFFVDGICRGWIVDQIRKFTSFTLLGNEPPIVYLHDYVGREAWYDWAVRQYKSVTLTGGTLVKMRNP